MNSTIRVQSNGIISNEDFITWDIALAFMMLFVSSVGIISNSINIRTFVSMGLEDGLTVCLMGLATSDLGSTFFTCILSSSNIIAVFEEKYELKVLPIQPRGVFAIFSMQISLICYQFSSMITTFMAVARCMCVAMPFQFKNYFTKSRSISAMVMFFIIALAFYLPVLSQMGAQHGFDRSINKSRIVLWLSSKRSDIKDVTSFVHLVIMVFVSSFLVIVCVVVMSVYLRQSVKFRQSMSTSSEGQVGKSENNKLTGKELQAVQQVLLISIIYTVCMFPTICLATYRLIDSDFDIGKRLHNFYFVATNISGLLGVVNSATTFLVYYGFNSKFRSRVLSKWQDEKKQ